MGYGLLHREDLVEFKAAGASRLSVWDALSAFGLGESERALLTGNLESLQGATFEGRYVLLSELGRGGMGMVSRAFDTTLNRVVALKRLLPEAASSNAWDRFFREARSLARLDHPSCVRVYDYGVGQESEMPYMALQLVLGRSLRDRVSDPVPASWEEVARWGQQLAEGLAACHAVGLVHRDIKPGNILLERSNPSRALLADFGIAFAVGEGERLTKTGGFLGSYLFCAPETLDTRTNTEPNPRSDLYSLGLSLYVALTHVHPYDAKSLPRLLSRMEEPITPVQELAPDTPDWLASAIQRCLERKPEARFRDAADLAYALGAGQSGSYGVAEVLPESHPRDSGRSRWSLAIAGALLFGGGLLTGRSMGPGPEAAPGLAAASQAPSASATRVSAAPAAPLATPAASPPPALATSPSPSASVKEQTLVHVRGNEYRNVKDGSILIKIPAATFVMGNSRPTPDSPDLNEAPAHYRSVGDYYIGKFEVTRGQWRRFCEATGRELRLPPNLSVSGNEQSVSAEHPMAGVGLEGAKAYCKWAGLRLPIEEEWEYAARGSDGRLYPWGSRWLPQGRRLANVVQSLEPGEAPILQRTGVSPLDAYPGTAPVDSFPEGVSPFGCFNMCGNISEWVSTPLAAYPSGKLYEKSPAGSAILRGGDFSLSAWSSRISSRNVANPAPGNSGHGFRVARSFD